MSILKKLALEGLPAKGLILDIGHVTTVNDAAVKVKRLLFEKGHDLDLCKYIIDDGIFPGARPLLPRIIMLNPNTLPSKTHEPHAYVQMQGSSKRDFLDDVICSLMEKSSVKHVVRTNDEKFRMRIQGAGGMVMNFQRDMYDALGDSGSYFMDGTCVLLHLGNTFIELQPVMSSELAVGPDGKSVNAFLKADDYRQRNPSRWMRFDYNDFSELTLDCPPVPRANESTATFDRAGRVVTIPAGNALIGMFMSLARAQESTRESVHRPITAAEQDESLGDGSYYVVFQSPVYWEFDSKPEGLQNIGVYEDSELFHVPSDYVIPDDAVIYEPDTGLMIAMDKAIKAEGASTPAFSVVEYLTSPAPLSVEGSAQSFLLAYRTMCPNASGEQEISMALNKISALGIEVRKSRNIYTLKKRLGEPVTYYYMAAEDPTFESNRLIAESISLLTRIVGMNGGQGRMSQSDDLGNPSIDMRDLKRVMGAIQGEDSADAASEDDTVNPFDGYGDDEEAFQAAGYTEDFNPVEAIKKAVSGGATSADSGKQAQTDLKSEEAAVSKRRSLLDDPNDRRKEAGLDDFSVFVDREVEAMLVNSEFVDKPGIVTPFTEQIIEEERKVVKARGQRFVERQPADVAVVTSASEQHAGKELKPVPAARPLSGASSIPVDKNAKGQEHMPRPPPWTPETPKGKPEIRKAEVVSGQKRLEYEITPVATDEQMSVMGSFLASGVSPDEVNEMFSSGRLPTMKEMMDLTKSSMASRKINMDDVDPDAEFDRKFSKPRVTFSQTVEKRTLKEPVDPFEPDEKPMTEDEVLLMKTISESIPGKMSQLDFGMSGLASVNEVINNRPSRYNAFWVVRLPLSTWADLAPYENMAASASDVEKIILAYFERECRSRISGFVYSYAPSHQILPNIDNFRSPIKTDRDFSTLEGYLSPISQFFKVTLPDFSRTVFVPKPIARVISLANISNNLGMEGVIGFMNMLLSDLSAVVAEGGVDAEVRNAEEALEAVDVVAQKAFLEYTGRADFFGKIKMTRPAWVKLVMKHFEGDCKCSADDKEVCKLADHMTGF